MHLRPGFNAALDELLESAAVRLGFHRRNGIDTSARRGIAFGEGYNPDSVRAVNAAPTIFVRRRSVEKRATDDTRIGREG